MNDLIFILTQSVRVEAEGGDEIVQTILSRSASQTLHIMHCHQSATENGYNGDGSESFSAEQQLKTPDDCQGIAQSFLGLPGAAALRSTLVDLVQEISEFSCGAQNEKSARRNLSKSQTSRNQTVTDARIDADDASALFLSPALLQAQQNWKALLSRKRWMRAVKDYLEATLKVAHLLSLGHAVIVQNEEGRDAVTVVVSLAQVRCVYWLGDSLCIDRQIRTTDTTRPVLPDDSWLCCADGKGVELFWYIATTPKIERLR